MFREVACPLRLLTAREPRPSSLIREPRPGNVTDFLTTKIWRNTFHIVFHFIYSSVGMCKVIQITSYFQERSWKYSILHSVVVFLRLSVCCELFWLDPQIKCKSQKKNHSISPTNSMFFQEYTVVFLKCHIICSRKFMKFMNKSWICIIVIK